MKLLLLVLLALIAIATVAFIVCVLPGLAFAIALFALADNLPLKQQSDV